MEHDFYANMKYSKMTKEEIIKRWPFYVPRNAWTGEIQEYDDEETRNNYTLIEDIPTGWWIAFGEQMSDELKAALGKYVNDFRFLQIKEKYGTLRLYGAAAPKEANDVINKYEELSSKTCFFCGDSAKWYSNGYILPYCDKCKQKREKEKYAPTFVLMSDLND